MGFAKLADAIMNTEFLLDEKLDALSKSGPDGNLMMQTAVDFRRLACGALLMDLNAEEFSKNLYCSGKVYLELLKACEGNRVESYYHWRSHAAPLLDVIAAGAEPLAVEITNHSSNQCHADQGEIEEDYYYYAALSLMVTDRANREQMEALLAAFSRSLEGGGSVRYDVMAALSQGEEEGFTEAFGNYLRTWQSGIKAKREAGQLDPYDDATTANICVEGLALLNLARKAGMKIEDEYPFIPEIAITGRAKNFPESFSVFQSSR